MTGPEREGSTLTAEHPDTDADGGAGPLGGARARLGIALAVVLALLVVVVVTLQGGSAPVAPAVGPAPVAPALEGPAPAALAPVTSSVPLRVRVPGIGADSSLVPVGVDDQEQVQVPPVSAPMQAAWYSLGPTPGAIGPAVVLGHVNGNGQRGIFADLAQVRPGQEVEIDRADGRTAVFTVYRVVTEPKDAFPTTEVYGNTPDAQIRLVTCGGELDESQHSYLSNVIVYGTLTAVRG